MSPSPPGPALPRSAVLGAIIVVGAWALAVFWVAFSPPGGSASASDDAVTLLSAEVERLHGEVEALNAQVAALEAGRSPAGPTAGAEPPEASPTPEVTPGATASATSEPTPETVEPTPEPTVPPTSTPRPTPEATPRATVTPEVPEAIAELGDGDPSSEWYTDGEDLWSCHNFDSAAEAQEAYRANLPGDPNLIDTDRNGVACESRDY